MNENSLMQSTNSSPSVGHNLPGTSELLSRVEELESKIQNNSGGGVSDEIQESINDLLNNVQKLNAATNTYNKRFEKIEETVSRFEEMEKDIQLEYIDDEEEIDNSNSKRIKLR
jgi:septation ring formation regulator EzrA